MHSRPRIVLHSLCYFFLTVAIDAQGGEPPREAISPVAAEPEPFSVSQLFTPVGDIRLRYEYGDQDGLEASHAATLRARLGAKLNAWHGITGLIELEGTLAADNASYRAASVDGPTDHVVIADPESFEMNQLWLAYEQEAFGVRLGRQRIILDNARFIGNVGWRQNEQTFDAVTLGTEAISDLALTYTYLNRVNRIFGSQDKALAGQNDFTGDSHLLHAEYSGIPGITAVAYAYFLDLENAGGHAQSNQTFGLSLSGTYPIRETFKVVYRAEYARQTDAFDSPLDYAADYYHGYVGTQLGGWDVGGGFESLGSDDGVPVRTPLATLHAFNGFADVFLDTPAGGLRDVYLRVGKKMPWEISAAMHYHHFFAEDDSFGPDTYGNEIDLVATKKLWDEVTLLMKLAYYEAEDFGRDTVRFATELTFAF